MVNIGMKEIEIYEQWHLQDMSFLGGRPGIKVLVKWHIENLPFILGGNSHLCQVQNVLPLCILFLRN
jgi:hypothetical protein